MLLPIPPVISAVRKPAAAGKKTFEIMVGFTPKMHFMSEWWKQLYGESEGKDGKGIFPASVDMTTDLHSLVSISRMARGSS